MDGRLSFKYSDLKVMCLNLNFKSIDFGFNYTEGDSSAADLKWNCRTNQSKVQTTRSNFNAARKSSGSGASRLQQFNPVFEPVIITVESQQRISARNDRRGDGR